MENVGDAAEGHEVDEPNEAALAFEALRAEVGAVRRAVEALEVLSGEVRGPDYSPTLEVLSKNLYAVALRVDAIEKHTGRGCLPPCSSARWRGRGRACCGRSGTTTSPGSSRRAPTSGPSTG